MTNASESNGSASDTTSNRSRELPEDQLLRQEAAEAQVALQQAALQLGMVLRDAADMRRWIRRYPWSSVVAAAALGAVAVPAAVAGSEKVAERWQEREYREHASRRTNGNGNGNGRKGRKHSSAERGLRIAGLLLRQSRKLGMLLGGTAAAGAGAGLGDLLKAMRAGMRSYAARETERTPDEQRA